MRKSRQLLPPSSLSSDEVCRPWPLASGPQMRSPTNTLLQSSLLKLAEAQDADQQRLSWVIFYITTQQSPSFLKSFDTILVGKSSSPGCCCCGCDATGGLGRC